jgi:hypothetical protein
MAQTGYTPIQLYHSTAAGVAPTAGNLLPGEPAINIADMALYFENSGGLVRRLMNNPAGLQYPVADGTSGQMLITNGSGVLSFTAPPVGTVTSVGSGTGLTGGPITSSGTLSIDTGVVVTLTGTQTLTNKTLTAPVLTGGTANGLVYLNGSAVMVSSSSLTFNGSTLAVGGTISETVSSTQYLVASQYDVGIAPNKIPLNQYLGALAYRANAMVPAPASATAVGNTGDIAMDSSYFYVCIAPNTWKRVAIATW